jgi:diadenosine tetraphosphatase ApaH/serine/threonine PP2A family protein phosphatase
MARGDGSLKRAIISDIHANLAAFERVLADIGEQGVTEVYCLGDIIGYGPDPRKCLDLARTLALNLMGNHEEAVLFGAVGFNPKAKKAIEWTVDQLNLSDEPQEKNRELWNFIGSLARQKREGRFLFVHGSPRDPTREYIFKQDFRDRKKMDDIFSSPPESSDWQVCFAGHTHHPGIFAQAGPYRFIEPQEIENRYPYSSDPTRILVNVGSVGQPRDGDPRISYVVVDEEFITFRRLDYEIERTVRRFNDFPDLPDYLARRLHEGK